MIIPLGIIINAPGHYHVNDLLISLTQNNARDRVYTNEKVEFRTDMK